MLEQDRPGLRLRIAPQDAAVGRGIGAQAAIVRAMSEASRVVSEHQIRRITEGRLAVADLDPASLEVTLPGFHVTPGYLESFDRVSREVDAAHEVGLGAGRHLE